MLESRPFSGAKGGHASRRLCSCDGSRIQRHAITIDSDTFPHVFLLTGPSRYPNASLLLTDGGWMDGADRRTDGEREDSETPERKQGKGKHGCLVSGSPMNGPAIDILRNTRLSTSFLLLSNFFFFFDGVV